jgi:hypothetical protein
MTTDPKRKSQANEMPGQLIFWILAILGLLILVMLVLRGNTLFKTLFGT